MPTGPECEKRPADVLSKRRFKPSYLGSLQRSKAGASEDLPPALTSEGDRGRLLPGLLAVARSNIALYYLTDDL